MTLFDTSVIIDARDPDSPFHEWAKQQIARAVAGDGAAVNTVIISEASVRVVQREQFPRHLENIGLTLLPLPVAAAVPAARSYAVYLDRLKAEGKTAKSKIPLGDFLIGAPAEAEGMTLVTRDPARVSVYFPQVELIQP
jgi:predicted nucleic acid-binding protein